MVGGKIPYLINVRWASIGAVLKFYARHREILTEFLVDN